MAADRPSSKKIAYYCVATHLGGAERSLLDLVARVREQSADWYRPWVILPAASGPLIDRLQELDIPYEVLPIPRGFFEMSRARPVRSALGALWSWPAMRAYLVRLVETIRAEAPALIHTTGIKCHALGARIAPRCDAPVLWHLRDILESGAAGLLLRRLRRIPGIHVVTNSLATARAFDPRWQHPVVVYNGIDVDRFVPGRDGRFRAVFGVGENVPIVGIVGVIQRGKGLDDFLEMAQRLHRAGHDARYVIVGDEIYDTGRDRGYRARLEQRVRDADMTGLVHFAGFEPDSVAVMQGLDLLVSASTRPESFGRVLIEAMACRVPVVASAAGGVVEIVDDRHNGRLYPPGDVDALERAVGELLGDREMRGELAAAGRERVLRRFTVDSYVAGIVRTYDRILRP